MNTYLLDNCLDLAKVYLGLGQLQSAKVAVQKALELALNPEQEQAARDLLEEICQNRDRNTMEENNGVHEE